MSFDTYDNFKAEVADWLNRADLTAKIPSFIQFAEAVFNRKLRTQQMITRAEATIVDKFLALPSDFAAMYDAQLLTDPVTTLTYMTPAELHNWQRQNVPAKPKYYTIVGNALEFGPVPDNSYDIEIVYWGKIPALTNPADTNWVLTNHPDLYLYTTLKQAAPYLQNDERMVTWGGLSDQLIEELVISDERAVKGGVPMKARIKPYVDGRY